MKSLIILCIIIHVLLKINSYYIRNSYRYRTILKNRVITIDEAKDSFKKWNEASSLKKYDNNDKNETFHVDINNVGCSVAEYLSKQCTYIGTKNRVHKVCRSGKVLLNDVKVYSSTKLILNDVITIDKKGILEELKVTNTLNDIDLARLVSYTNSLLSTNQNPPFHILYEDNLMSVVFKPPGVHSMKWTGTMKRRLFALDDCLPLLLTAPNFDDKKEINEDDISLERPIPQHRLDARVAGCLVIAKSRRAAVNLHQQFERRIVKKEYLAILVGRINTTDRTKKIIINDAIDGLASTTELTILQECRCPVYGYLTTVRLFPLTGRRHQLRRHCSGLGNPIVGDNLYHYASYAQTHAQRLLDIQEVSDKTKSPTEVSNAKKLIDMDDDLNDLGNNSNEIDNINYHDDDINDDKVLIKNDIDIKNIPQLRKGSIYLMAIAIEMKHPNNDEIIRIESSPLPRFNRIIEKAKSGWEFNYPDELKDSIISYNT